jgi:hypothetical protein
MKVVSFACVTQQLMSADYIHFPERHEAFAQYCGEDSGVLKCLRLKVGIHVGECVGGSVAPFSRQPILDCFGTSVAFTVQLQTSAPAGRIQLSAEVADIVQRNAKWQGLVELEPLRKTLTKRYGTISTFLIRSTTIQVPEEVIDTLKITRAARRQYFGEQVSLIGDLLSTEASGASALPSTADSSSVGEGGKPKSSTHSSRESRRNPIGGSSTTQSASDAGTSSFPIAGFQTEKGRTGSQRDMERKTSSGGGSTRSGVPASSLFPPLLVPPPPFGGRDKTSSSSSSASSGPIINEEPPAATSFTTTLPPLPSLFPVFGVPPPPPPEF